ncbi:hypothetical protein FO519_005249 [Halicephalobus sp. NKZ332]|nr:hypothetical protein FO519_005249 [Halicephalobus sp. NKZ332]
MFETTSREDWNYTNCPGTFLGLHKKCRKIFPRNIGGIKLDIGKVDGEGSRIQVYYNKFGPDIGGLVDYKFDESARFRYISLPVGLAGRLNRVQLDGRTENSGFGVEMGPALSLHYLRRLKDIQKISNIPGLGWTRKLLNAKEAQLDLGGQLLLNWNHMIPFLGFRYSISNYTAAMTVGYGTLMASIWCATEGAQFGISHEHYMNNVSVTTFGCKKEYTDYGFTHTVACSTNQTLRIEFEQRLPTTLPMRLVLSYAVQMQVQHDRLGVGLIIN